ncbi:MAG: glycosyl hydrolase family 18 protein [Clostridia bacterium]|nr:glycosyl hydrolase family 18 protein [Clostridia bacterium]
MNITKRKFWHKALALSISLMLVLSMLVTMGIQSLGAGIAEWQPNTDYAKDDVVSYQGKLYQCIAPHKSLDGWQPPNVQALWKFIEGTVPPQPTPIATNTPVPTVPPSDEGYTISGYIKADVVSSDPSVNAGFKVELWGLEYPSYPGFDTVVYTDNNGYFEMKNVRTDIPGTYFPLKITKNNYLLREIIISVKGNVTVGSKSKPVPMWAGDMLIDGKMDYAINMSDIVQHITKFNTSSQDSNYDVGYDFNKDKAINMEDILTIINHFNKTPDDYPKDVEIIVTTPTPKPSTPPPTIPPNGLPTRIMSGYWHTWGGGPAGGVPFVKLRDVDPGWDVINVSFAEPVSPGSTDGRMKFVVSGLPTGYTINDFKADIKLLQSQGRKVVLSIGGYEGYFSLTSSGAVSQFVSDIKGFINEYGFDGIDIDLEQSSVQLNGGADPDFRNPKSPKVVNMIAAIKQICDSYGSEFILSWAPETFYMQLGYTTYAGINGNVDARAGCYIPLIYALRDKTTYVQAQLYNSGPITGLDGKSYNMGSVDGIVAMCEMLIKGFNVNKDPNYPFPPLRPDQVVIAVPASANAAGSGQISNAGLQQAFKALADKYPTLRGIMAWSINWDNFQNGNSFLKGNNAVLKGLPPGTPPVTTPPTTPPPTTPPTSPPIPSVTPPTTPPTAQPTGLPKRVMVGYWHTWGGGPAGGVPFVKLRDVDPGWDVINISFAEPVSAGSSDGRMKFVVSGLTTGYTINDFKADIKLLQSKGKKIVLSIGGYEGFFSLLSASAVNQFVSDIKGFVNEYGFDGIDIDLEQSSVQFNPGADPDFKNPTSPKIVNMISAIRQICNSYDSNFMLTWAPETFYFQMGQQFYGGLNGNVDARSGVYIPMIHALRDKTTFVHAQLYNSIQIQGLDGKYYSMGNTEAIVAMCEMLLQGFKVGGKDLFPPLRPDQVVIGVPSSPGAAGSGQISNAGLQQAFSTLVGKYPAFRGIMTWSINWDAYQNSNTFVKENGAFIRKFN